MDKTIIIKTIYIHITNDRLLNINEKEFKLLDSLTLVSVDDKLISESRNIKFVYEGDENNYNSVSQTIILYLFIKGMKVVYLDKLDANKDFKINKEFDLSFKDYLEGKKKETVIDNVRTIEISDVIHARVKMSRNIIEINIKENGFKELYDKVKLKPIDKYTHLIELYNYTSITINNKIKNLNYFMIIESLANYHDMLFINEDRGPLEKIKIYFDSKIGASIDIFSKPPNEYRKELYDIRSSIVHNGDLNGFRGKRTKHFMQNKSLKGINNELDRYVKHVLEKDIEEFMNKGEEKL